MYIYSFLILCHLSLFVFQEGEGEGKRRCPVCHQLRTATDKTPEGEIHRVLQGRRQPQKFGGHVWCAKRAEKFLGLINIHNRCGFR